jgi:multiple sugar transport system permease protein
LAQATSPPAELAAPAVPAGPSDSAGLGRLRAFGFTAPALLLIAVFLVIPALWTLYLGLTDYRLLGLAAAHPHYVGISNYKNAISDPSFSGSLGRTLAYVFGSAVIGQNVLGFTLSWILRGTRRWARAVVEAFVLVAWILPGVVVAWLWIAFLSPHGGTVNAILQTHGYDWLFDHPMASLIVFNTWRGTAFSMMLYGAAIASIPPTQLESARMAGARGWRVLADVVFPHIRGHALTNTLLITLWTFNDFTPYLLTLGQPDGKSETLPVFIYLTAIPGEQLGYASAISLIMIVINLILAVVYLRVLRRRA